MAKLPDFQALGQPQIGESRRPISSVDTAALARGAAATAASLKDIGTGLASAGRDISATAAQQERDKDELELAKAESEYLVRAKRLDDGLAGETTADKLKERYEPEYGKARDEAAAMISNPRVRELWLAKRAPDVEGRLIRIGDKAFALQKDSEIAGVNVRLEEIRESALSAQDPAERSRLVRLGNELITGLETAGYIDKTAAEKSRRAFAQDYAIAAVSVLPPEEQVKLLRPKAADDQVVDRIIGIESGGKATAKNANTSAYGVGQFTAATWLGLIRERKPDLAQGRGDAELLALRSDPVLSREMVAAYAAKNKAYLESNNLAATPANVYLAHFLGPEGARRVLEANGDKPVSELLSKDAVKANPSVLGGKTAASVVAWANDKMGGERPSGTIADPIPMDKRMALFRKAETEVMQRRAAAGVARGEEYERGIIDAAAGQSELPDRSSIETDPVLTETARNALLRQYDRASSEIVATNNAMAKFSNPQGGAFNPYDTDDRNAVDRIYQRLGGNDAALKAVVERTGILPKNAATQLRGDLISSDPARVSSALNTASNLLAKNANIFATMDGRESFENNVVAYRHYVEDLGKSADEAAKLVIRDQSPEYQASVKARIKSEDIDDKIRKSLGINDLASAFDTSILGVMPNPQVGFDAQTRAAMYGQFAERVKENYLNSANGDWALAKKQAANDLKKTWGVSRVNGSAVVMPYPPELSPAFSGIENASERIAMQAVESIKAESGQDIDRKSLRIIPIPGVTSVAFKAGQPAPYAVSWQDKDGVVHMLNPGRAFVADPKAMSAAQSAERQAALTQRQAEEAPILDRRERNRAVARGIREAAGARIAETRREVEGTAVADR